MLNKIVFILLGVYLVLLGIIYYFVFRKHHKRNKVELDELIELVTKFYSLTTLSVIMIVFGIYLFINAAMYRYDIEEVIGSLVFGTFIIGATIINYINYLKNSLKDYDEEIRQETRKRNIKIGEILELIIFGLLVLYPLYKIPMFIRLSDFKKELYIEIAKAVLISVASLFLLINLNPLDLKEKIFKKKSIDINEKK